ncbi:Structure-specific endonuclease subunit SLX4 [Venturia nashicola]|uniref:Structure-specific endonuclease subunit SLX4 n=1 Tax=Venturia nashicola TaxID=86259 RepID=A0A4Z1NK97_9PEZI|nr:Structure-specific endonuclease subunit SLX4 [Venturia nashicola]TLD23686.1 Structure-specific endonuclease subunit SLX4 [Venturia nashicola]
MASTEIVVLRSSSPHPQRAEEPISTPPALQYVPNSSSSDGSSLPSVSKLWTKWDPKQKGAEASRVSPLPLDSRLKGGSPASALPTDATFGFQSVKGIVGRKELSIEEEIVAVQGGQSKGGKAQTVKETGAVPKSKKPRSPTKTKMTTKTKAEEEPGIEKEVKTKARRKSRAKVNTVDTEGTVSNPFDQSVEGQRIGLGKSNRLAKEVKPKAKRKSRAKPVVSTHFDQNNATETCAPATIEKKAVLATKKRKRKDGDDTEEKSKSIQRASKEDEGNAPKPRNQTGKASTHFTNGKASEENKNQTNTNEASLASNSHKHMDMIEKRRKSWTPVQDTAPAQLQLKDIYEVPSTSQPPSPVEPKPDFHSMIGNFGFDSGLVTRSASPEKVDVVGLNKRRRVEPIDDTTLALMETTTNALDLSKPGVAISKEAKKKSPKKPAFSITNKVINKYAQPAEVTEKTSIYFAPRVEPPTKAASPEKVATLLKTKKASRARPKGPVKPRATKKAAEEDTKVIMSKAKAKAKAKSMKPKKVVDVGQKLISPSGIASRAEQQIVMFGTSSQLLTGDSPNTLRQLRDALRESEMMTSIEEEPTCTAPVQRRLARGIRHTSGKLWAQQAVSCSEDSADSGRPSIPTVSRASSLPVATEGEPNRFVLPRSDIEPVDPMPLQGTNDGFQTLSDEIEAMDFENNSENDFESPGNRRATAGGFMPTQTNLEDQIASSWRAVPSAPALPDESPQNHKPRQPGLEERDVPRWHIISSSPGLPEDETQTEPMQYSFAEEKSPIWHTLSSESLPEGRDSIDLQKSPSPDERTIKSITKHAAAAPTMRSSLFASLAPSASRTALRPLSTNTKSPKKSSPSNKVSTKSALAASNDAAVSPKKKRDRPPKSKTSEEKTTLVLQSTPKKKTKRKISTDEWHDINDEIMDSEPDMTPSPRRRGKKAPPSPLPDLVSNAIEVVTKRSNGVLANANHPQWPEIQAKLFPDITLVVKGQTRSTGGQKLTWYEKILMYDPLVIEDLTAFVNAEGLSITVKEKEENIRGWMVQKWCEDNSVCCLWREGLRGGAKTKY